MMRTLIVAGMVVCAGVLTHAAAAAATADPPSRYGVDAPELAPLGPFAVGYKTLHLVQPGQIDVLTYDAATGTAARADRILDVELWYPALASPASARQAYAVTFPAEVPGTRISFSVSGIAMRDAAAAGTRHPLVIVSHSWSTEPAAMSWITENLASKGYVVAAMHHNDPPINDRSGLPQMVLRRPLDIAYVTETLQKVLAAERLIDPARTALIGYSIGGYGVLTAAGATLDPGAGAAKFVPGGLLLPYTAGGALRDSIKVKNLRAVVAISPAGGGALGAWGADGVRGITAPLLLISGDRDRTVDYSTGARAIFDRALAAPRYLLTFHGAGHSLGVNPAPDVMRQRLWDQDWFEDPVWRKNRINAINAHFITAFLDRYLKSDESRAAYLDVRVADSAAGVWPATETQAPPAYDAFSPGSGDVTVWKGFQRGHAVGLEMLHAAAQAQ